MLVALIQGGPSSEAEVSRASAAGVGAALEEAGHEVARIELSPEVGEALRASHFDVVFPVVHGAVGEDGSLQGLLEVLGLPYVGSGVLGSALAMNKAVARVVLAAAGCPVARGASYVEGSASALDTARLARRELGRALVVKPAESGSAIGVTRLEESATDQQLAAAIEAAWALDDAVVVEEFLRGKEVTCGVVDLVPEGPRALAAIEIAAPMDAFYTYEARYAPGRSRHVCPAPLGDAQTREVQELAVRAHRALGCRDLSRADFIVASDRITLLEVNTIPGMTATSLYPEAADAAGLSFPVLCDALVRNAQARGPARRNEPLPLPAGQPSH
ncbi:MAG TPA: D-alanine--D-alanine ligase [Polyangiaceae bacterium]|nr:D-alanine--D-alanine ligase [Polyangiaceae bacterium]